MKVTEFHDEVKLSGGNFVFFMEICVIFRGIFVFFKGDFIMILYRISTCISLK